jgi:demethylmenaquinone methyltransferase / 2-methoxy-6-polyprenyl-1,4-benzoquinol methylase
MILTSDSAGKEQRSAAGSYSGPNPQEIRSMFAAISRRYDRANTVISAGVHHLWRRKALRLSGAKDGDRVLDCATGTGDLALAFRKIVGATGEVVGTDFVPEMLVLAREKARRAKLATALRFDFADVMSLPFEDDTFDIASISFGIRNVLDPVRGIAEMARVVRPGGRVMVLEFGQPRGRVIGTLFDFYRRRILPRLGGVVTGEQDAYEYLDRSAARFPAGEDFASLMRSTEKFASIDHFPLSFGIAYVYRGTKRSS